MARTALVIGLGGTGQWVLTYLKKNLIEAHNGRMPDNVRLLAFDVLPLREEMNVGGIRLDDKEFLNLGKDVYNLRAIIRAVDDGELPHISSWFPTSDYLRALPPWLLKTWPGVGGKGQMLIRTRQLVRLILLYDLAMFSTQAESWRRQAESWRRLDTAATQLVETLHEGQRLEIILVGSLAGQTGSGFFIDIALLTRHRARDIPHTMQGYLVLPSAFDLDPDENMLSRSFAAWRELNRFLSASGDFPLAAPIYGKTDALRIREVQFPLFDICYIIDGVRNGKRVAADPTLGVFPLIAETIEAILDEEFGKVSSERFIQLIPPYRVTWGYGLPLYSTLGACTFKVPVYRVQRELSLRLILNWLDALLKPIRDDPQNTERVTRLDPTSPYNPTRIGRDEALSLLTTPQEYQGQSEVSTFFVQRVAEIVTQGGADNPDLVEEYAWGSWKGQTWLDVFTKLDDRAALKDLIAEIHPVVTVRLLDIVMPGEEVIMDDPDLVYIQDLLRKRTPLQPSDIEKLEDVLRHLRWDHWGGQASNGEIYRGKFGEALDKCSQVHLDIFRRLVQLWLLSTLMGKGDPLQAKSGRLGYAFDLLDGLVNHFQAFLEFMGKVAARRQELLIRCHAWEECERRKQEMLSYASKKFLLLFNHPKAYRALIEYLKAEQAAVDVWRDELLHWAVLETVKAMQDYCVGVRDELACWIQLLATGNMTLGVEGLYTLLRRKQREIEQMRRADERLTAIQVLLREPAIYPTEQEELKYLMAGVTWRIDDEAEGFRLQLSLEPPAEQGITFHRPAAQDGPEVWQHLTQRNLEALQGYTSRRFSQLPAEVRVAEILRRDFTPEDFADKIGEMAKPLHERQPATEVGPVRWSELIRIQKEGVDEATLEFIREVERIRRRRRGMDPEWPDPRALIQAVGSANPHKCTVVRTDDLLPPERFRAWHDCKEAYLKHKEMPLELNHIFLAEANAARYELKVARRWARDYSVFHPWVVTLLEYPDRLEQFFLCWALQWIQVQQEQDGARLWYELKVPGYEHEQPFLLTPKSTPPLWSLFQVARTFVLTGLDQGDPERERVLNYSELQKALDETEQRMGVEGWMDFLREQVTPAEEIGPVEKRLVARWLRYHIEKLRDWERQGRELPKGEPVDYEKAYKDLADVAEIMFVERLERKEI